MHAHWSATLCPPLLLSPGKPVAWSPLQLDALLALEAATQPSQISTMGVQTAASAWLSLGSKDSTSVDADWPHSSHRLARGVNVGLHTCPAEPQAAAQAYEQAAALVSLWEELPMGVEVLVQLDRLVHLLEAPPFTRLRLHLLQPSRYPALIRCAGGLDRLGLGLQPRCCPACRTAAVRDYLSCLAARLTLCLHSPLPGLDDEKPYLR